MNIRFPTTCARLMAAAALLCAMLPLQSARADALTPHSKAVFDSPSLPCMAEAIRLGECADVPVDAGPFDGGFA